jgi:hypothetical protein
MERNINKRVLPIFSIGILLSLSLIRVNYCIAEPDTDILGWGKVKWGMTHSQVSKLYELEDWRKDLDYPSCKAKTPVDIHGYKFSIHYTFDKKSTSGKVKEINLIRIKNEKLIDRRKFNEYYKDVYQSLIAKYGKPTLEKLEDDWARIGQIKRKVTWIKGSGKLEFYVSALGLTDKIILICSLKYSPILEKEKL